MYYGLLMTVGFQNSMAGRRIYWFYGHVVFFLYLYVITAHGHKIYYAVYLVVREFKKKYIHVIKNWAHLVIFLPPNNCSGLLEI